jgi:hypothetical protein
VGQRSGSLDLVVTVAIWLEPDRQCARSQGSRSDLSYFLGNVSSFAAADWVALNSDGVMW